MDSKTIYVRTSTGEAEIGRRTNHLSGDIKRALLLVDGKSTVEELLKHAAPSLRPAMGPMLTQLLKGGFIEDKAKPVAAPVAPKPAAPRGAPPKMAVPGKQVEDEGMELDFTTIMRAPTPQELAAEGEKIKAREAEAARLKAEAAAKAQAEEKTRQEAEAARLKAAQEAAKARAEAEAKAVAEAQEQARREIEAARLKAAQEAAKARAEAEAKAVAEAQEQARREIEAARLKAEQEAAKARAEAAAAKAKAEAEAKAVAEAQEQARREIEAARLKAEQEAAKARAEAEAAKAKAEAEAKAVAEGQEQARREIEAARLKAEQEAQKARAEAAAAKAKAEAEAKAVAEAQEQARREIEAARLKAEQEAAKARAEAEAAKAKAEAEAKAVAEGQEQARREIEAARLKAEQEAAKARAEAEAAKAKAEQEAQKARAEAAAAKAKAEAEEKARVEAQEKARAEAEALRLKAEQEAERARAEAEEKARAEAQARIKQEEEAARIKVAEQTAAKARAEFDLTKLRTGQGAARSTIATVLFFDVVGYTKQSVARQIELKGQFNQLVSEFLQGIEESQRIILDTGDGAAIGFLQHPEDALEVALKFRTAVTANRHQDYPELNVRIGIHLGPVNVVKDMNGQYNMVGDGINDAQRIMSFAGTDQLYVSRAYFDVVSRLNADYAGLFKYRGVQKDKHGRDHQVYQVMEMHGAAVAEPPAAAAAVAEFSLGPITLNNQEEPEKPLPAAETKVAPAVEQVPAKSPEQIAAEEKAAAQRKAQEAEVERKMAEAQARAEAERRAAEEEAARKLAAEQAKAWSAAEQRAKAEAEAQARVEAAAKPAAAVAPRPGRARRKPLPWGKIGAGLFVLALALIAVLPYVWPLQGYIPQVEQRLSSRFGQPVRVGAMSAALLPTPKLELHNVTVGGNKELQVASVVLHFGFTGLLADTRVIDAGELHGLHLDGAAFERELAWLQAAGGDARYPLRRLTLQGAHIDTDALKLPAINGKLEFDGSGRFAGAELGSENGKINVQLQAQAGKLGISLSVKDGELPMLPAVHFADFNADGKVTDGGIDFSKIDAQLYTGTLTGNAQLSWQQGWLLQGRLAAQGLDAHTAFPNAKIEGELQGNASYALRAQQLAQFGASPALDGEFSLQKGELGDMDVVEVVRLASREGVPGRTHFDELSGRLNLENGIQHYRQLHLAAGVLNVTGYLDIDGGGGLNGHFLGDLKIRNGSVPLLLTGKLGEPSLRAAR